MTPRRIRLLYVVGKFETGGAERHLLEMWRRLDRSRFDVRIATFHRTGAFLPMVEALSLPILDLRIGRRIYDLRGVLGFLRLVHHVLSFRPDIIHGYLFGPNLFAALAGRLCGVPAALVAKRSIDAFETPRQVWVQRVAHRLATHVTAVSEVVADSSVALGVPRSKVKVITNGVDTGRFHDGPRDLSLLGLGPGPPIIGTVGCLELRKDPETLLEALAGLAGRGRDFRAVLIGEGSLREALEARAADLGLASKVTFLGDRQDIERLLPALDLFVLSSREEGIPNALLEAMAAGRPSVATSVGGTPEVMRDGETGWLVPARSPEALAQALESVLTDPDEARRRGAAARRYAVDVLSIDAMVRRHEDFYASLPGVGRV